MTREEAIHFAVCLKNNWTIDFNNMEDFCNMVIEALTEPKTIIGIDIPYGSDKGLATIFKGNERMVLEEIKEIMSVVRCKDCKWYNPAGLCERLDCESMTDEDYCSYGERREE